MSTNDLIPLAIAAAFAVYLASLVFVFLYAGPLTKTRTWKAPSTSERKASALKPVA